jgi:hypothetical protein
MLTWGHFSPANYQAAHSADFLFVQIEQRKRVRPAAKGSIPESPFPERALQRAMGVLGNSGGIRRTRALFLR